MSVVVVGSANLDLVYRVKRIPGGGETVLATGRSQHPGGKGENQAIAAARAGADTRFVVALGADQAGEHIASTLRDAHVTGDFRRSKKATGTALITVDERGENTIVVDPGANATLTKLDEAESAAVRAARVVLLQLEIPLTAVLQAAELAAASGARVVLNAAPTTTLPDGLLGFVDVLVVNEHEAAELVPMLPRSITRSGGEAADRGVGPAGDAAADPAAGDAARALLAGVPAVVVTLGGAGCLVGSVVAGSPQVEPVPARRVTPVDTTGAGDTFCGALAASLDAGFSLLEAARFATAAAGLAVQRQGAVPSIPTRDEIVAELARAR